MNTKRYFTASICVFIFIFLYDWLVHGMLLHNIYQETASLWRPQDEMLRNMPWVLLGQILFSLTFCFIFLKGYENKGIGEGVRYGLLIGCLYAPSLLIEYSIIPYTIKIILVWIFSGFIEMALAGAILAKVYKK